jgi:RNA polymerase sigma factor (sigma-70 family)
MEPMNQAGAAAPPVRHLAPGELDEAFYAAEYLKLVKILVVMGATMQEAEDAAQRALEYIFKRSRAAQDPIDNLDAYICRTAIRFFIKERQRNRERLPREIKGGHLTLPAHLDDELTAWEDKQWVEHVLQTLTPARRDVFRLVMEGASTREIAEILGKKVATIRQHEKGARDCLKTHPEIVERAPRTPQARAPAASEAQPETTAGEEEVK